MSVAALSNASISQFVQASSNLSGIQQALQSLQQGLAAGNLTAAKNSFSKLQQLNQNLSRISGATSAVGTQTTTDLNTLGTALNSGDLTGAQTAFTAVQQDLTGSNSAAITAAVSAANQEVQQIDALLGISGSGSSNSSSLSALLGSSSSDSSTPDIAAQTTSILGNVYGNHSASTPTSAPSSTGTNVNVSA